MASLLEVFLAFVRIGALSFGGAYAAIPLVEQEVVVARGWMTYAEFADLVALDELTPGPILINSATFVGMKASGVPGAIAATLGCVTVPCIVTLALVWLFRRYKDNAYVKGILLSLKCMALALIASTLVRLAAAALMPEAALEAGHAAYALAVMAVAVYLLNQQKAPTLAVLVGCGVLNVLVGML